MALNSVKFNNFQSNFHPINSVQFNIFQSNFHPNSINSVQFSPSNILHNSFIYSIYCGIQFNNFHTRSIPFNSTLYIYNLLTMSPAAVEDDDGKRGRKLKPARRVKRPSIVYANNF